MNFLKICKNKTVISIILSILVLLGSFFIKSNKSYAQEQTETRIEYSMNKSIGIKTKYHGKRMQVRATAYTNRPSEGGPISYTGEVLKWGHIAVDKDIIPLGSKVYIPQFNQVFIAVDTGSAIKNNRIDIYFNDLNRALEYGIQDIEIIILNK